MSHRAPILISLLLTAPLTAHDAEWPEPTRDSLPLVHWWWPADLPAEIELSPELDRIAKAGFGGVEIHPAPAALETGNPDLEWLDPAWIERLAKASKRAKRLGLRIDLSCNGPTLGSLPTVPEELTASEFASITATTTGGPFEMELPLGRIDCLAAWPRTGPPVDLIPFIDSEEAKLTWDAPPGNWSIYGVCSTPTTGPDPFSTTSTTAWLESFDAAFQSQFDLTPRTHTLELSAPHTVWSHDLIPVFQRRRGYDLREQLPALFGDAKTGTNERVLCDYRETLADLQRDSLLTWHRWTTLRGSLSRTRIAGTAANPLDLHGIPDIPGFTVDGIPRDADLPRLAFAASAAHLHTKPLVSATAFHDPIDPARVTPAMMKEAVDMLWLAGANHLVLDGILASPTGPSGPSGPSLTPLGPGSGRWRNLRAFNDYLTRCQSILQSGAPDPEVLLYYPAHDFWTERGGIPADPTAQARWLRPTAFFRAALDFQENGIPYDYVSDLLLANATVSNGQIILGGLAYKTLVLPEVRHLPEKTAQLLLELTRRGAKIAVIGQWPIDVPGFPMPDIRRGTLFNSIQQIPSSQIAEGEDPVELVRELGVIPEPMATRGLHFVRRSYGEGRQYFIVNRSERRIDDWIPLSSPATSAVLMDPRFLRRTGLARTRLQDDQFEVHLTLEPGESRILRTFTKREATGPAWTPLTPTGIPLAIAGIWKVEFIDGGPELPDEFETPVLGSWSTLADPRAPRFSGTARYTIIFDLPEIGNRLLDLGEVAHSARVIINDADAGVAFTPPHQFDLSRFLKEGTNTLAIEVTNLPQNSWPGELPAKVADTGNTEPPPYRSYDPSTPSGLLGPVRLIPLNRDFSPPKSGSP